MAMPAAVNYAIAGCRPILVATDENYQLRKEAIAQAITPKTRAVVTISHSWELIFDL
jgi:aspartate/methionine/tyrosine aminotransferase